MPQRGSRHTAPASTYAVSARQAAIPSQSAGMDASDLTGLLRRLKQAAMRLERVAEADIAETSCPNESSLKEASPAVEYVFKASQI
jgi:hypothetical protein